MMRRAIAHHLPTDTQPVPEWRFPTPPHFPVPVLDVTSHGMEYTVGQFGSAALVASCANFLCPGWA